MEVDIYLLNSDTEIQTVRGRPQEKIKERERDNWREGVRYSMTVRKAVTD